LQEREIEIEAVVSEEEGKGWPKIHNLFDIPDFTRTSFLCGGARVRILTATNISGLLDRL
jgi:hypothetical protein